MNEIYVIWNEYGPFGPSVYGYVTKREDIDQAKANCAAVYGLDPDIVDYISVDFVGVRNA